MLDATQLGFFLLVEDPFLARCIDCLAQVPIPPACFINHPLTGPS